MDIPTFESTELLHDWMIENKSALIATKKMQTKAADAVFYTIESDTTDITNKSEGESEDPNMIRVKAVINTTNILDSHGDVHLDGIWNKSVKEQKNLYLLEEHKMSFRTIISDEVKASVEEIEWKKLGVKAPGTTQALVFDATIKRDRNEYMFEQYSKGFVKNHSVGMRYTKIELAINNKDYKEEFRVWEKNIDKVINRKDAEAQGYFWAVSEAKIVEGSAVPLGSNTATPTLSVEQKNEPSNDTHITDSAVTSQNKSISIYSFN